MKYTVSLQTADKTLKKTAESVSEALSLFDVGLTKSKSILTVKQGKKRAQKMLFPMFVRRLVSNHIYRELLGKQLTSQLK